MTSYLTIFLLIAATGSTLASEWKYEDEDHWAKQCKQGKEQSPIALSNRIANLANFESIHFNKYNHAFTADLKNNGHSAEVRLERNENSSPPLLWGGNLSHTYVLDHLHFHWQSEHIINNYRFPLELHLVHYAQEYANLQAALQHPKGVAVFAVLFDLSPDDDVEFTPLIDIIDRLKDHVNQKISLENFVVRNFIPRDTAGYYRYNGSLTTPECNEGILWTVFTNTIPISLQQVKVFEDIQTNYRTKLSKNYRSLQALNSRDVLLKVSPLRSSASIISSFTAFTTIVGCFFIRMNIL